MNSCATAEDAGLKNAFQEIVNSLRTILSGTHTSFVQKHMTWPMRLEAESSESGKNEISNRRLEANESMIFETAPLPTMFGSAMKPKKLKKSAKKRTLRKVRDEEIEADNTIDGAVIDDEISFKQNVPEKHIKITPERKKNATAGSGLPRSEKLNLSKVSKKSLPRVAGRPPKRAAFSKASAIISENPTGLENVRSSRRLALSSKMCPRATPNSARIITNAITVPGTSMPREISNPTVNLQKLCTPELFSMKNSTPHIKSPSKIIISEESNEIDKTVTKAKSEQNKIDCETEEINNSVAHDGPKSNRLLDNTVLSPVVSAALQKSVCPKTKEKKASLSESSDQNPEREVPAQLKDANATQRNEKDEIQLTSKKRKSDSETPKISTTQSEIRRSGRLKNQSNASVTVINNTPGAKKLHELPPAKVSKLGSPPKFQNAESDRTDQSLAPPASSRKIENPDAQISILSNTPKVLKNSTSRVLNKPALPLPKFSSNSQKFTTGRYFSSLKPPSGSSSSHQVLEGKRDVNVTRPIQSKISEDVGFSGERVDPKRGFDSQHKWENTFEHTKHISFSVSSALANSSEDRASKKKYPVSPMAENLLKKSFKQPFMNCLDEEDSDEEVASQSRADSILSSKVTQKNPNETFNASKVSNCTYVAPKVSTIVAPSPLSKVCSIPSTPSSNKWDNSSISGPKSVFGCAKPSNLVTNTKSFWNTSQTGTPSSLSNKLNFKKKENEAAELKKAAIAEKEKRYKERLRLLQQKQEMERLEKKKLNEERCLKAKQNVANFLQQSQTNPAKNNMSTSTSGKVGSSVLGGIRLNPNLNPSRVLPSVELKKVITSQTSGPLPKNFPAVQQRVQLPIQQKKYNYCVLENLNWTSEENEEELEDDPEEPKNVVPTWAKKPQSFFGAQKSRPLVKKIRKRKFVKVTTIPTLEAIFMSRQPRYERPRRSTGVWHTVIDAKINDSLDSSMV